MTSPVMQTSITGKQYAVKSEFARDLRRYYDLGLDPDHFTMLPMARDLCQYLMPMAYIRESV